jgi:hypothetical protein
MTPSIRRIATVCAEEAGLPPGLIFRPVQPPDGRERWRGNIQIVRVRHLAMWIARRHASPAVASLPEIGRRLGGWDHTTVRHGIGRIEALLATDCNLQALRDRVLARLAEPEPKPKPVPLSAAVQAASVQAPTKAPRQIAIRVKVRSLVPPMPASEVMRRRMERAYPGGKGTGEAV